MRSKDTVCDYCGEPSKLGWYRFDGGHVCDDCGDFVLNVMGSNESLQTMVSASSLDKGTQKLHGNPALLGKVNGPLKDLLVGVASEKHDVVILDSSGHHYDSVIVDPAKPRKLHVFCQNIVKRLIIIISHMYLMFGVIFSPTNV